MTDDAVSAHADEPATKEQLEQLDKLRDATDSEVPDGLTRAAADEWINRLRAEATEGEDPDAWDAGGQGNTPVPPSGPR